MKLLAGIVLAFATMGTALASSAPSFAQRLSDARRIEREPMPGNYLQTQLVSALEAAPAKKMIANCLKSPGASTVNITMVATISSGGRVIDVDYRPGVNRTGHCLAEAIRAVRRLPAPPGAYRHGLPIFIDWNLADEGK